MHGYVHSNIHEYVGKGPSYVFRGLVCYYGLHYVSIFQEHHQDEDKPVQFLLFDDNNVRLIGVLIVVIVVVVVVVCSRG